MALLPLADCGDHQGHPGDCQYLAVLFEIKDSGPLCSGQASRYPDLPIHDKQSKRMRSYSVASWPDGSNTFELVIVLMEGGAGTTYLFKEGNPEWKFLSRAIRAFLPA